MTAIHSPPISFHHVESWIEGGGYAALFLLLLACGLGLPIPEDVPLIISGILISQNHMHLIFAAPIAWAGILGGDSILYTLGHRYGRNITRIPFIGAHVTMSRIERAELLFAQYGVFVVAVGRMFAGVRGAMVVAAGITRFKFYKFIVVDAVAAVFSGGIFLFLGYWFGSNLPMLHKRVHEFRDLLLWGGFILAVAGFLWYWLQAQRKRKTVGDKAMEKLEHHVELIHSHQSHAPGTK